MLGPVLLCIGSLFLAITFPLEWVESKIYFGENMDENMSVQLSPVGFRVVPTPCSSLSTSVENEACRELTDAFYHGLSNLEDKLYSFSARTDEPVGTMLATYASSAPYAHDLAARFRGIRVLELVWFFLLVSVVVVAVFGQEETSRARSRKRRTILSLMVLVLIVILSMFLTFVINSVSLSKLLNQPDQYLLPDGRRFVFVYSNHWMTNGFLFGGIFGGVAATIVAVIYQTGKMCCLCSKRRFCRSKKTPVVTFVEQELPR